MSISKRAKHRGGEYEAVRALDYFEYVPVPVELAG
jgi:hypothetical protein